MAKKGKEKKSKNVAQMIAYGADGNEVLRQSLSIEGYYEGLHDLIDSDDYRRERGIVRLTGQIYDHRGVVVQDFENEYKEDGSYKRGRERFEDGTVNEHGTYEGKEIAEPNQRNG